MSCNTPAASKGGKANKSKNEVTSCAHTKKGKRKNDSPGTRNCTAVTMIFTEPSKDEVIGDAIAWIEKRL